MDHYILALFNICCVFLPIAAGVFIGGRVAAKTKRERKFALNITMMILWCGMVVWLTYFVVSWVYGWFKGVL